MASTRWIRAGMGWRQGARRAWPGRGLLLVALILYGLVLIRTAWVCDDAFITLRTVDNWTHGYGLTWNTDERVQCYSHPLWMMLLGIAYGITREPFLTTLALSMTVSLAAVVMGAFFGASSLLAASLGTATLIASKAFVDYSTSGLENPLAYLLVTLFYVEWSRGSATARRLALLSFLASLVMLTRLDLGLLVLPPLALAVHRARSRRGLLWAACGMIPLALWELFSLWYYGSLFPNTAYAKLGAGVGLGERVSAGFAYLGESLASDHVTLPVILAALLLVALRRELESRAAAVGILLYLVYVVGIEGDFMSGRELAVPFLASVLLLIRAPVRNPRIAGAWLGAVALLGFTTPHPSFLSGASYGLERGGAQKEYRSQDGVFPYWVGGVAPFIRSHGISDERAYYYQNASLLRRLSGTRMPDHVWVFCGLVWNRAPAPAVFPSAGIGMGFAGYYAGPRAHIIDQMALTDPLLARLPALEAPHRRVGHLERAIPQGYTETLETGRNVIADPELARYYDAIRIVTRGSLWSAERMKAIWLLNIGAYDHLIDARRYRAGHAGGS